VTEPGIASRTLLQASGQSLSEFEEIGGHTPYFLDGVQLPEPENSCLITNVIEPVNRVCVPRSSLREDTDTASHMRKHTRIGTFFREPLVRCSCRERRGAQAPQAKARPGTQEIGYVSPELHKRQPALAPER
jgi:hypothetical protein